MASRHLFFALALTAGLLFASPPIQGQTTDVNAEARVFFDRGTELLERAERVQGRRRRRLLQQALQAFVSTLRIVRSRNALFNAALVLEQLDRPAEAFAYYREYLDIPGLSSVERQQAQGRIDVLRPVIAVVSVRSTPPGADVFVDRLDLAPRGRTPLQIALSPGEHTLYFRHPHYEDAEARVVAETGTTRQVEKELTPHPVEVRFEVPANAHLSLNGEAVESVPQALPPGEYVARLEVSGRAPTERRFVLRAGDEPRTLRLEPGPAAEGTLIVQNSIPAHVTVDGRALGAGRSVEAALPPGSHRLRVAADHHRTFESVVSVEAGRHTNVSVTLAPQAARPLGALPHIALGATGASVAVWAGLSARALRMRRDHDDACTQERPECNRQSFRRVERANLTADVILGVAGALATTTLVLYLVNRKIGEPSRANIELSVAPGATHVQVGGRF